VNADPDETCNSILAYLNNQMSHGRSYCGFTNIRGGWRVSSCPTGQVTPVTLEQPGEETPQLSDTGVSTSSDGSLAGAVASESLADVFHRINPAVVDIVTTQSEVAASGQVQRVKTGGLGSGFLISDEGLIMTAAHVVQTAEQIVVRFVMGAPVKARVIASDPQSDVALIQVEAVPEKIQPVELANSNRVRVGDQVFIVGAPLGISHTLTVGHISARRNPRHLFGGLVKAELLQTDAAINPGNSGGPMFNMQGDVIGIVSHIASRSGGSEGIGFVVTSNLARQLLIDEPTMWSGMKGSMIQGELARVLNLPQPSGIIVEKVVPGSPASVLGLQPGTVPATIGGESLILGGDVILNVQGIEIGPAESHQRIRSALSKLEAGAKITVTVLRGGEVVTLSKMGYLLQSRQQ
jgi:S1-C subfamily serine protease